MAGIRPGALCLALVPALVSAQPLTDVVKVPRPEGGEGEMGDEVLRHHGRGSVVCLRLESCAAAGEAAMLMPRTPVSQGRRRGRPPRLPGTGACPYRAYQIPNF